MSAVGGDMRIQYQPKSDKAALWRKLWVSWLLLFALLLSSLIPTGMMPGSNTDGTFTVILCTSSGLRHITMNSDGKEVPPISEEERNPCIYSSVLGAHASINDPLKLLVPSGLSVPQVHAFEAIFDQLKTLPVGARAPPASITL
ncbi:DUF2946 family protein [Flexibacterium corallicola]|uniref:DUF2946 family protein n=1 Tax=Flexibacterium corallicola TaxID=3037259 RepID=UPI00286ED2B0|nr:DUF2946 family protein [Pseudovibrio sp. M1P-2-3]